MIRRKLFENAGESFEGASLEERCPGETNCTMFQVALGETQNGLNACNACELLPTKPGNEKPEELEGIELFAEVEQLIFEDDAGSSPDFDEFDFEIWKLFVLWRTTESQIKHIWNVREQMYLKAQFEQPKR